VYYEHACANSDGAPVSPTEFLSSQIGFSLAVYAQLCGVELADGAEVTKKKVFRAQWRRAAHTIDTQHLGKDTNLSCGSSNSGNKTVHGVCVCISAGSILLELLGARKRYCTLAARNYSVVRASKMAGNAVSKQPQTFRAHNGANPVTLAHLVSLAVPEQMEWFLDVLSRDKEACLFRDEFKMHSAIQSRETTEFLCFTYVTTPGFSLLPHMLDAMVLVVTNEAPDGKKIGTDHANNMQVISTFEWDEDEGAADFLWIIGAEERFVTL
jgi:hypothetical protein